MDIFFFIFSALWEEQEVCISRNYHSGQVHQVSVGGEPAVVHRF